jgi:hypoxanthine phosphoribosyltransferase
MSSPESPGERVFSPEALAEAVTDVATEINAALEGPWLLVCIMNGGLVFAADLMRKLTLDLEFDYMRAARYHAEEGGDLVLRVVPETPLAGRQVLLVDDIFDEGRTLAAISEFCRQEGATAVRAAVLLDKPNPRRVAGFSPDFVGLVCPDRFVFGYGMDLSGRWRALPDVRALD